MENKKRSMINILANSSLFGPIAAKAEQLVQLNRIVHQKLDPKASKHCRVANLRDGVLVLMTHSSSYGHLLRFSADDLLTKLRSDPTWCHLKSIKTIVRAPVDPCVPVYPLDNMTPKPYCSKNTASIIQDTAFHINNPSLQKALLKLSKTLLS